MLTSTRINVVRKATKFEVDGNSTIQPCIVEARHYVNSYARSTNVDVLNY